MGGRWYMSLTRNSAPSVITTLIEEMTFSIPCLIYVRLIYVRLIYVR